MIHWAWLILAFYVGAASAMLIGLWAVWQYIWTTGDDEPPREKFVIIPTGADHWEYLANRQPIDDGPAVDKGITGIG